MNPLRHFGINKDVFGRDMTVAGKYLPDNQVLIHSSNDNTYGTKSKEQPLNKIPDTHPVKQRFTQIVKKYPVLIDDLNHQKTKLYLTDKPFSQSLVPRSKTIKKADGVHDFSKNKHRIALSLEEGHKRSDTYYAWVLWHELGHGLDAARHGEKEWTKISHSKDKDPKLLRQVEQNADNFADQRILQYGKRKATIPRHDTISYNLRAFQNPSMVWYDTKTTPIKYGKKYGIYGDVADLAIGFTKENIIKPIKNVWNVPEQKQTITPIIHQKPPQNVWNVPEQKQTITPIIHQKPPQNYDTRFTPGEIARMNASREAAIKRSEESTSERLIRTSQSEQLRRERQQKVSPYLEAKRVVLEGSITPEIEHKARVLATTPIEQLEFQEEVPK